jgi:hypothetical protein
MDLEEIKKRLDREYMGVTDSCGQDVEYLIAEVERLQEKLERATKLYHHWRIRAKSMEIKNEV